MSPQTPRARARPDDAFRRGTTVLPFVLAACGLDTFGQTGGTLTAGSSGHLSSDGPTLVATTLESTTSTTTSATNSSTGNNVTTSGLVDTTAGASISSSTISRDPTGELTTGGEALSCAAYCATIGANCAGADAQYGNNDTCLATCAAFPPGTLADVSGNTLGCRNYHAGAAAQDASTHCVHAGPGGDGICGGNCESFCIM